MIRMSLRRGGRRIVVLGLEPDNLRRMQAGEPIKVNLRELDPDGPPTDLPDVDVMVASTETDDWRDFLGHLGITELPRRGGTVCAIPDCGCTGEAHP